MVNIIIAGDFAPMNRVKKLIEEKKYSDVFSQVKEYTNKVDYSIVNFESPVVFKEAKPISKTGPNLKCSKNAMEAIKYAGFNCVTLANNHFRDYGQEGVEDTIKTCEKYNIDFVGGGKDIKQAEEILYKDIDNKKIAIVNFCENEWSIATEIMGGSAPLNFVKNYYQIQEAKKNSDYVIVIVHGGIEHYQLPTPRMKKTYRFFIDIGADVIVNHHQHCFSGYEEYKGKFIFYGLGNFCFDRGKEINGIWNKGYMVELNLDKDKISFNLLLYRQCAEKPIIDFHVDKKEFNNNIKELNNIINDDEFLLKEFNKMVINKKDFYSILLEPYNNKYLRGLRYRKLIPSLLNKQKKMLLFNLFRCEAHRDVAFEILKDNN